MSSSRSNPPVGYGMSNEKCSLTLRGAEYFRFPPFFVLEVCGTKRSPRLYPAELLLVGKDWARRCVFARFRVKRREAELAGLKEALNILESEAASLIQRSSKRVLRGLRKHA